MATEIKREFSFTITPEEAAKVFCGLGSDDQAKFFVAVEEIMGSWEGESVTSGMAAECQALYIADDLGGIKLRHVERFLNALHEELIK